MARGTLRPPANLSDFQILADELVRGVETAQQVPVPEVTAGGPPLAAAAAAAPCLSCNDQLFVGCGSLGGHVLLRHSMAAPLLKQALARTLTELPWFAGRLIERTGAGRAYDVTPSSAGARLLLASSSTTLDQLLRLCALPPCCWGRPHTNTAGAGAGAGVFNPMAHFSLPLDPDIIVREQLPLCTVLLVHLWGGGSLLALTAFHGMADFEAVQTLASHLSAAYNDLATAAASRCSSRGGLQHPHPHPRQKHQHQHQQISGASGYGGCSTGVGIGCGSCSSASTGGSGNEAPAEAGNVSAVSASSLAFAAAASTSTNTEAAAAPPPGAESAEAAGAPFAAGQQTQAPSAAAAAIGSDLRPPPASPTQQQRQRQQRRRGFFSPGTVDALSEMYPGEEEDDDDDEPGWTSCGPQQQPQRQPRHGGRVALLMTAWRGGPLALLRALCRRFMMPADGGSGVEGRMVWIPPQRLAELKEAANQQLRMMGAGGSRVEAATGDEDAAPPLLLRAANGSCSGGGGSSSSAGSGDSNIHDAVDATCGVHNTGDCGGGSGGSGSGGTGGAVVEWLSTRDCLTARLVQLLHGLPLRRGLQQGRGNGRRRPWPLSLIVLANMRPRLRPPLPAGQLGNYVWGVRVEVELRHAVERQEQQVAVRRPCSGSSGGSSGSGSSETAGQLAEVAASVRAAITAGSRDLQEQFCGQLRWLRTLTAARPVRQLLEEMSAQQPPAEMPLIVNDRRVQYDLWQFGPEPPLAFTPAGPLGTSPNVLVTYPAPPGPPGSGGGTDGGGGLCLYACLHRTVWRQLDIATGGDLAAAL